MRREASSDELGDLAEAVPVSRMAVNQMAALEDAAGWSSGIRGVRVTGGFF